MQVTRTPADVLATLSRRYREHYGDRLAGVYAVPEDPYEERAPTENELEGAVEVFVVLKEPYEPFEETDDVTRIAYEVMDETDWDLHVIPHHDSETGRRAEWAKENGVEL
jgi:hypothetical protein